LYFWYKFQKGVHHPINNNNNINNNYNNNKTPTTENRNNNKSDEKLDNCIHTQFKYPYPDLNPNVFEIKIHLVFKFKMLNP